MAAAATHSWWRHQLHSRAKVKEQGSHRTLQSSVDCLNRMSWIPLLILCGPALQSGLHNNKWLWWKTRPEQQVEVEPLNPLFLLLLSLLSLSTPPCIIPLPLTGDPARGALINLTFPATASSGLIPLLRLYRGMAIRTKRQRETKRDGCIK